MKNDYTITIPLTELVDAYLGVVWLNGEYQRMWNSRPIPSDIASIILLLTKNKTHCYIQEADEMSPHLKGPLLWDLSAWQVECDRWSKAKVASDKRRIERFIFEANIKIVSKAICSITLWDGNEKEMEKIQATAFTLLSSKKMGNIRALGINKLIEKENEL